MATKLQTEASIFTCGTLTRILHIFRLDSAREQMGTKDFIKDIYDLCYSDFHDIVNVGMKVLPEAAQEFLPAGTPVCNIVQIALQ
mmetsp:Transcript_23889/g.66282  ORF Transcript_23889/g.66282 Transcript_23889/m.66282 type:complete len:85 (+) Transcript_23889:1174-1428(+)